MAVPPMKASIVTGCVVPRDAISNIARQQADALGRPATVGATQLQVRLFAMGGSVADSRLAIVPNAASLAADAHFQTSDVVVFHFGIRYPAFDAIQTAPRTARVLAYYHGITPPALCDGEGRSATSDSYRQANHLLAADAVLVTSKHLVPELRAFGIEEAKIVRVPPAVAFDPVPRTPRLVEGGLRFLYVGRFVPAKGVLDLIEAFQSVAAYQPDATLDLAGSLIFSDESYLRKVERATAPLGDRVRFHFDRPAPELAALFASADVCVSPSYHEGFGVPIVEALAAGCYVICSDAGASAETANGLGLVYGAGRAGELAECFRRASDAWANDERPTAGGTLSPAEWRAAAAEYAATFTLAAHEARFRTACLAGLRPLAPSVRAFFAATQDRVMRETRDAAPATRLGVYDKFWQGLAAAPAARRAA